MCLVASVLRALVVPAVRVAPKGLSVALVRHAMLVALVLRAMFVLLVKMGAVMKGLQVLGSASVNKVSPVFSVMNVRLVTLTRLALAIVARLALLIRAQEGLQFVKAVSLNFMVKPALPA